MSASSPLDTSALPIIASFFKPLPEASPSGFVEIFHPLRDIMFLKIPVRNCPLPGDHQSDHPCIPLTTVLDACGIVTGRDGVLALYYGDRQVVQTDLVAANQYYYIASKDWQVDYAIFHSFDDWVPPERQHVPDRWFTSVYPRVRSSESTYLGGDWDGVSGTSENTLRLKARSEDQVCKLSGFPSPLEVGHIVPKAKGYWYHAREVVRQLYDPVAIPGNLQGAQTVHDIRNYITLRTDLHSRWDADAFIFVPVDGYFIAYYITSCPEVQAADFHCARLVTPQRMDGYLLYIRFALSIFAHVAPNNLLRHPQSSPLAKPPSALFKVSPTVSQPPSLPATTEEGQTSAGAGLSRTVGPSGADPSAVMDDVTAAKHIIDWYSDVDRGDLPADLAWVWRDLIKDTEDDSSNLEQLKREWLEQQRRQLSEDGQHSNDLG